MPAEPVPDPVEDPAGGAPDPLLIGGAFDAPAAAPSEVGVGVGARVIELWSDEPGHLMNPSPYAAPPPRSTSRSTAAMPMTAPLIPLF